MSAGESQIPDDLAEVLALLRSPHQVHGVPKVLEVMASLRQRARRGLPLTAPLRRQIDSEDLVQDTVMDLMGAVHRFRGTTWPEFLAFANAVLAQRATQQRRRARVRAGELSPMANTAEEELPGSSATPSVDAAHLEDMAKLGRLIDALPGDYRRVLRLRLEGLDGPAIAARLGVGEDAVRQRISRALSMLRQNW